MTEHDKKSAARSKKRKADAQGGDHIASTGSGNNNHVIGDGSNDDDDDDSRKMYALLADNSDHESPNGSDKEPRSMGKRQRKRKDKDVPRGDKYAPKLALTPQNLNKMLNLADLQNLVLYIHASGTTPVPSFVTVENRRLVKRTIVVFVPGMLPEHFGLHGQLTLPVQINPDFFAYAAESPCFGEFFAQAWPTRCAGDSFAVHSPRDAMLQSKIPAAEIRRRQELDHHHVHHGSRKGTSASGAISYADLLLTEQEMLESGYVLPPGCESFEKLPETYVPTRKAEGNKGSLVHGNKSDGELSDAEDDGENEADVLSLDCEMVGTQQGDALARITLVDAGGRVIMDELVQPGLPVLDYRTPYSGMTAERLAHARLSFAEARAEFLSHVHTDTILVGHSLESDLSVLRVAHGRVVDTAHCYGHPRGGRARPSLRWLAQRWLQRQIQADPVAGHDSVEDAQAALDLVRVKLRSGRRDFGLFRQDHESIFVRLGRDAPGCAGALVERGSSWAPAVQAQRAERQYVVTADSQVSDTISRALHDGASFVFAQCYDLGHAVSDNAGDEAVKAAYRELNAEMTSLWDGLPPGTLLVVYGGTGDVSEMRRLQQQERTFRNEFRTRPWDQRSVEWGDPERKALRRAVDSARTGVSMIGLKR